MQSAFEEGLKIGRNDPCSLALAFMLEYMTKGNVIGISISDELRDRLDPEHIKTKFCDYPVMEAHDLSKGMIVHFSDGSAIWWDGIQNEYEPYWPHHFNPDAFAR